MEGVAQTRILLLSQAYEPITVISWQRALTLLTLGKVEVLEEYTHDVRTMTLGEYPVETWLWFAKKRAVLFSKGAQVTEADWNTVAIAQQAPPPAAAPKKKTR